MKAFKLLLTVLLFATFSNGWADQIITISNDTIECKIEMAGKGIISYRPADKLNGPVQRILKSQVQSINYQDISEKAKTTVTTTTPTKVLNLEETVIESNKHDDCAEKFSDVTYNDYKLFRNGVAMNKIETYNAMYCYHSGLAGSYMRYSKMKRAGIVLTSIGTVFSSAGIVCFVKFHNKLDKDDDDGVPEYVAGVACTFIGLCTLGSGIPLMGIGHHKRKEKIRMFNENYLNQQSYMEPADDPRFQLGITTGYNKIGLGLTF